MRPLAKKTRSVLDGEDGVAPTDYAVIVGLIIVVLVVGIELLNH